MESLKTPSKYHLSMNFLALDHISIFEKFKTRTFPVIRKYHLSIKLLAQKKNVFPIS